MAAEFPAQKSGRSSRRVRTAGTEKLNSILYKRINGNGELMETENVIFYVSYGVLREFLRMNRNSYVLCYGDGYGNGYVTVEISHEQLTVT